VERAAKEGLVSAAAKSVAGAAQPAAPQADRAAISQDADRSVIEQDGDRFAIANVDGAAITSNEDASRYCPVCSQRLESRRCKLICPVCGYYMSCADYY
jgi:hypothetical protein